MLTRPIIVVGTPRSGTTILTRCLSLHPDLWHLRAESHHILEGPFHPTKTGYQSNRITAADLSDDVTVDLRKSFYDQAINQNLMFKDPATLLRGTSISNRLLSKVLSDLRAPGVRRQKPARIRFLEKTPKNSLRIPMFAKLFPDALFIWNRRNPETNIDSLIDGWQAQNRFFGFSWDRYGKSGYDIMQNINLIDYQQSRWKFVLVPGWKELNGKRIADAAALQYVKCHQYIEDDLKTISKDRVFHIQHEEFVRTPQQHLENIFKWCGLEPSILVKTFANSLPKINSTKKESAHSSSLRFKEEVHRVVNEYGASCQ